MKVCAADEGAEYLKGRGLTDETMAAYRIGYRAGHIVFPFFADGKLAMVKELAIERVNGKKDIRPTSKDQRPVLFGWQAIPTLSRSVTICEGEIDAMTLFQYGFPALSVPFGGGAGNKQQWIEHEFENLERFDTIYLAMDGDEEGASATLEIARRLGLHRCRIVRLPFKDANECLQQGISKDEIAGFFEGSQSLDPEELRTATSFSADVYSRLNGDADRRGLPLPWRKTHENFRIRYGEVTIWTGISGHGKSLLLGQIMGHLSFLDSPAVIASFEMPPALTLARMVRQVGAIGTPSRAYSDAILRWMDDRIYLFEGDTKGGARDRPTKILDVFRYARKRYGTRQLVIDSLMKCGIGEEDYDRQKEFMSELCDFAKEQDCHVHVVMHPRKGADEASPPGKLDVKGSGSLTDLAWNVLTLWRNKTKERKINEALRRNEVVEPDILTAPDALLICSKQRDGGWEGNISLWFDPVTGVYLESKTERPRRYIEWSAANKA